MQWNHPSLVFRMSTDLRRARACPLCGERNFAGLSQHLAVAHKLDRQEIVTLLAYTDQNNNPSSIASVSSSSPTSTPQSLVLEKSPRQTPISINTNNQQITCPSSPINESDPANHSQAINGSSLTTHSSPADPHSTACLPLDGKKRLLCPRCDTWVLNLTDHLIKKHHLISKQDRLPFLRLARNRYATPVPLTNGSDQTPSNSFLISPDHSSPSSNPSNEQPQAPTSLLQQAASRKYHSIVKKYRKKMLVGTPPTSSSHSTASSNLLDKSSSYDHSPLSLSTHEVPPPLTLLPNHKLLTMNSIQSLLGHSSQSMCKQEKFKFPLLNENFASRSFPTMKTLGNSHLNGKDPSQVCPSTSRLRVHSLFVFSYPRNKSSNNA